MMDKLSTYISIMYIEGFRAFNSLFIDIKIPFFSWYV